MFKNNIAIGNLIRQLRKSAGMSQMKLADKIGVSYQQVQKYEKGVNTLNLFRLNQMADALGVSVEAFMEKPEPSKASEPYARYTGLAEDEAKLLMLFRRLESKRLKVGFIDMLEDVIKLQKRA